ncbi:carbohydrate sulfotransferase 15-like [Physella acuta]|uniref:carbohydrate sulfotransferase 15-like n=1 Tax=Physella acuta TaxID=109671 RepID=UPI0027DE31D9|nr:carbohydrate sulfotransferase 15-like [Physella acuta]XP_059172651.1 carbohydrate sulfotransferase 15-like [Physella acuta]XP_059172659.1 carbohydrate sulfotransferase 15-like [Physella acuta]
MRVRVLVLGATLVIVTVVLVGNLLGFSQHQFATVDQEANEKDVYLDVFAVSSPTREVLLDAAVGRGISRDSYFRGENTPDDVLAMERPFLLKNYKNPCWHEADGNKTLRCLPYFHLMGVCKSGTSDLWNRMTKHPEIATPNAVMNKETHWWSWRRFGFDIWSQGDEIRHFDWYLSHFDSPARKIEKTVIEKDGMEYHPIITGEGSPTVFWDLTGWDRIPQNKDKTPEDAYLTPHCIKHLTPDAKLIVIFRDPTKRMYSDYLFLDIFKHEHNLSVEGFHQDVRRSIDMLDDCYSRRTQLACLMDKELHMRIPVRLIVGMYDIFLEQWLKVFPPNQILVMTNEEYSLNLRTHLEGVYKFLGLSPLPDDEMERIIALPRFYETKNGKELGPMLEKTADLLNDFYSKHNRQLSMRFNNHSKFLWSTKP